MGCGHAILQSNRRDVFRFCPGRWKGWAQMKKKPFEFLQTAKLVPLDSVDRKILQILQRNNRLTNLELAEKVHVSPPTCMRRVRRLRKEGVIIGDITLVDPMKVGKTITAFVDVVLERNYKPALSELIERIKSEPEIMQAYPVSGDSDVLLVVVVDDMPAYQRLVQRFLVDDPMIRTFHTRFVLQWFKFKTEIELYGA
jgi:Lrp/AsnC family leucine-responsive transcriptional regulator